MLVLALLNQNRDNPFDGVGRYRKSDSSKIARIGLDCSVDSYYFAVQIQQRASGVAGVYRSICVYCVRYGKSTFLVWKKATNLTHDPCGHGSTQAERISYRND